MQAEETKMILRYFGGIEAQLDDVNIELAELRDRYNPIKGIAMDGMPHGSTPGDSTASLAVKLADDVECQRRENELRVRQDVLRADQTTIRGQLDRLNKTEITAQRWEKFALVVLGSMLDEVPMVEELLSRAYDTRD